MIKYYTCSSCVNLHSQWDTLLQETKDGVADRVDSQVSWDGLVFPSSITLPRSPLVAGPESDSSSGVNYPGARCIKPYENRVPDESNVAEFTYESLVFGLCLASALIKGTVMGEKQVVSQEVVAK